MITLADVEAAAKRVAGLVVRTPTVASHAISAATGADVVLKLDNLQVTGAFKERGAANRERAAALSHCLTIKGSWPAPLRPPTIPRGRTGGCVTARVGLAFGDDAADEVTLVLRSRAAPCVPGMLFARA